MVRTSIIIIAAALTVCGLSVTSAEAAERRPVATEVHSLPATQAAPAAKVFKRQVIAQINTIRRHRGLRRVTPVRCLSRVSHRQARALADGRTVRSNLRSVARRCHTTRTGEVWVPATTTPQQAVTAIRTYARRLMLARRVDVAGIATASTPHGVVTSLVIADRRPAR